MFHSVWLVLLGPVFLLGNAGGAEGADTSMKDDMTEGGRGGISYFFEMEEIRARTLVANIEQVQIGDTRAKVLSSLGRPWLDMPFGPKETDEISGRIVRYYTRKCHPKFVNQRCDRSVTFQFGVDDRLKRIYSNIDGVRNRP